MISKVVLFECSSYNERMRKILVISLYNGDNEIDEIDEEEYSYITSNYTKSTKGDRVIWLGEEYMYMEI